MSEHEATIGEVTTIEGKQYTVEHRNMKAPVRSCDGCSLWHAPFSICWNVPCCAMERDDGLYVKFVEVLT